MTFQAWSSGLGGIPPSVTMTISNSHGPVHAIWHSRPCGIEPLTVLIGKGAQAVAAGHMR